MVEWELKGVPLRIEVGPRDLDAQQVTVARRDSASKTALALSAVSTTVPALLGAMQTELLERARQRLSDNTADVDTVPDAIAAAATGFARIPYAMLGENGEDELAEHAVTVRCPQTADGDLPGADESEDLFAIVARSY